MNHLFKNKHKKNHVISLRTTCEESVGETIESSPKDSHETHSKESDTEVHFCIKANHEEDNEVTIFFLQANI